MLHTAIARARQVRRNGQAGFTLIELLIVIVILGVLAAIVVFSVKGITNKGYSEACKASVATIDTAFEADAAQGGSASTVAGLVTAKLLHSAPKIKLSSSSTVDTSAMDNAGVDAIACP